jgi:hypothetical protein
LRVGVHSRIGVVYKEVIYFRIGPIAGRSHSRIGVVYKEVIYFRIGPIAGRSHSRIGVVYEEVIYFRIGNIICLFDLLTKKNRSTSLPEIFHRLFVAEHSKDNGKFGS